MTTTITDQIAAHLHWCDRHGLRPATINTRRCLLLRLTSATNVDISDTTRAHIDAWWNAHTGTANTRAVELSHLRSVFRWALETDLITIDPTAHLSSPRRTKGLPRPVSEDMTAEAIELAPPRVREALILAAYAGLRGIEIAAVNSADIVWADNLLIIPDGKGGKARIVPMHDMVRDALTALCDTHGPGPLFRKLDGTPANSRLIQKITSDYLRDIGLPITLHQFRHRFATRLWQATTDLRVVQEMLGHSSPTTTAIYTAWSPDAARVGVAAL